jgi:hypothetical protein
MCPGEHVDAVDLVEVKAPQQRHQLAPLDRTLGARLDQPLRARQSAARARRNALGHEGPTFRFPTRSALGMVDPPLTAETPFRPCLAAPRSRHSSRVAMPLAERANRDFCRFP